MADSPSSEPEDAQRSQERNEPSVGKDKNCHSLRLTVIHAAPFFLHLMAEHCERVRHDQHWHQNSHDNRRASKL